LRVEINEGGMNIIHAMKSVSPKDLENIVHPNTIHQNTIHTLVENMVKKNRSRLSIAILLTTLICSH
jgi:hypothetical protein